ncbi:MAG: iron-sulfur cluster insertion protein ErpA [Sphingomicrobium sp.]
MVRSANASLLAAAPSRSYLQFVNQAEIQLTHSAARRVAAIAAKQARPAVLRLAVEGGGCAGFSYRFALGEPEAGDTATETDGVKLVVDEVSLDLVRGSAVDFVEDMGGSAFKVTNPNAASGCGCGSSFSI